jgi:pimeloyl-ACP methyl ester carboxylesterase
MSYDTAALDALVTEMITPVRRERPALGESSSWTERGTLESARGTIAYWSAGSGSPVLLVHGWEGTHDDLSGFVAPLVDSGRRVVALDLFAHGESSGSSASLDDLAESVRAAGARFGPFEGVIAHSIGCAAAGIALAGGTLAERAVLVSTPVRYERYVSGYAEHAGIPVSALVAAFARRGIDVASFDLQRSAAAIDIAALIVHSLDDRVTLISGAEAVAAAWRNSTFLRVDGLGHMRILRDPDTIAAATRFVTGARLAP